MMYGVNNYGVYLAHYGVVGMKWGVRRYQPYSYTSGRGYGERGKEIGLAAKLGRSNKRKSSYTGRSSDMAIREQIREIQNGGYLITASNRKKASSTASKPNSKSTSDLRSEYNIPSDTEMRLRMRMIRKGSLRTSYNGGLKEYLDKRREEKAKKEKDRLQKERLEKARQAKVEKQKAEKERLEKERQEKEQKERQEKHEREAKEKILKEGSADELYENRHKFSRNEIEQAMERIKMDRKIKDLQTAEKMAKYDQIQTVINKTISYGKTAKDLFDIGSGLIDSGKKLKKGIDELRGKTPELSAKEKAIASNDPEQIAKILPQLSNKEVQDLSQRFNNYNSIMNAANKQRKENNKNNEKQQQDDNNEIGDIPENKKNKKNKKNNQDNNDNNNNNSDSNNTSKDSATKRESDEDIFTRHRQEVTDAQSVGKRREETAVRAVRAEQQDYENYLNSQSNNKSSSAVGESRYAKFMKEALAKEERRRRIASGEGLTPSEREARDRIMDRIKLGQERRKETEEIKREETATSSRKPTMRDLGMSWGNREDYRRAEIAKKYAALFKKSENPKNIQKRSDVVDEPVTRKARTKFNNSQVARGRALVESGHTLAEAAKIMGVSPSTIGKWVNRSSGSTKQQTQKTTSESNSTKYAGNELFKNLLKSKGSTKVSDVKTSSSSSKLPDANITSMKIKDLDKELSDLNQSLLNKNNELLRRWT